MRPRVFLTNIAAAVGRLHDVAVFAHLTWREHALAQQGRGIVPALQERFGLSEPQVRGALGALLVFARERLSKPEFNDLSERIPNAERIMQDVKMRGIVTKPIDSVDEYGATLVHLGIGPSLASQFAPAVVEFLGAAGYDHERDILWRVLN